MTITRVLLQKLGLEAILTGTATVAPKATVKQLRKEAAAWSATQKGGPIPGAGTWEKCDAGERPSWDNIWMKMARTLAKRSVDKRTRVGAIIVPDDNTRVLALGYNGDWKGGPNIAESDEPGKSGFLHAELNALIKLDFSEQRKKVMYVTVSPCASCASAIINAGISEVIYDELYRLPDGIERLKAAGVSVRGLKGDA